jgi:hypothetical protein
MTDSDHHSSGADTPATPTIGQFTYRPDTDQWTWSDEVFYIHGLEPGEVAPSTDLVIYHMHPDDREAAWTSRERTIADRAPFAFTHRILDTQGRERALLAIGVVTEDGRNLLMSGHLVDLTDMQQDGVARAVDPAVADAHEHRAVIEQAKGVLMQLYAINSDDAWFLLSAYSQVRNRQVRDVAHLLITAATTNSTPSKDTRGDVVDLLDVLASRQPPD